MIVAQDFDMTTYLGKPILIINKDGDNGIKRKKQSEK